MDRWGTAQLARLRSVASDVTALDACIEVLRQRHSDDTLLRAAELTERLHREVTALIDALRT
jgi:hypothetical protein